MPELISTSLARSPAAEAVASGAPASRPSPVKGKEHFGWAVLRGVGRRWKQVVGFGLLAAAAVAVAIWLFLPPPTPNASAKLYMPQKPPTALGGEHPDPPLERQTQAELIKSRLVLNAAVRPSEVNNLSVLQAQPDPIDWLVTKVKVEFQGPEIIRISLSCDDADQARILVDAIKDSYLQDIVLKSKHERVARLALLTKMESEQKGILLRKRGTMLNLAKDGTDSERRIFQQRMMQDQMQAARTQLIRVESELRTGRLKEEIFAADLAVEVSDVALNQYVDLDRRVQESALSVKKLEAEFDDFRNRAADPKAQVVLDEAAKIATKQKEHESLREKIREGIRTQVQTQSKAERSAKHQLLKQDNLILEQQVKQLKTELDEYGKSLSDSRAVSQDLDPFRFEVKQTEELLVRIQGMIVTLNIEADTPPRVVELEKAVIAKVDTEKRKALFAAGGAIATFLLVFALIGLFEYRQRRVDSPNAISQGLGIEVFGTFPRPFARLSRWWRIDRSDDYQLQVHSEAIACARAMLLHGEILSPHRIFLITSPVSGEGKTTLTMQLAASVAQAGRQTLLVDGDLRKPSLHERLGAPLAPGVCEVLRGEASVFDVVQKTAIPGLMLISAGRWTAETGKALVTAHLDQLFGVFRDQFEFVLVDSSPALLVADALIIGRHTDGVILSLLQGVSRMPQATETRDRFTAVGVRVLGAFVNGTPLASYGSGGKYDRGASPTSGTTSSVEAL